MNNKAELGWQESPDGQVLTPDIEPTVSAQQLHRNAAELMHDHAEIAEIAEVAGVVAEEAQKSDRANGSGVGASQADLDVYRPFTSEEKAIGLRGVGWARASLRKRR